MGHETIFGVIAVISRPPFRFNRRTRTPLCDPLPRYVAPLSPSSPPSNKPCDIWFAILQHCLVSSNPHEGGSQLIPGRFRYNGRQKWGSRAATYLELEFGSSAGCLGLMEVRKCGRPLKIGVGGLDPLRHRSLPFPKPPVRMYNFNPSDAANLNWMHLDISYFI